MSGRNEALHLSHLLFVEQLAFTCHVSSIALGSDILSQRCNTLTTQDLVADGSLDHNLEQLSIEHIT